MAIDHVGQVMSMNMGLAETCVVSFHKASAPYKQMYWVLWVSTDWSILVPLVFG